MMKNNPNVIYQNGSIKGIYTKHSVTIIKNQEKTKEKYGYTLQEVNDRICSYRPNVPKEKIKEWDGKTWDYGLYTNYDSGDPTDTINAKLFKDFKILVKSAACMRGYQNPNKVRGGTYEDVDDFFNFSVMKLMERRLKQFDWKSPCRELDNWPSYLARVIPQYLIFYNKSKFDFEVESFWPLVKDEKTGEWKEKEFGVFIESPQTLFSKEFLLEVITKILETIPESKGFESDVLMYLVYGKSFSHQRLVQQISEIVKIQLLEGEESLL